MVCANYLHGNSTYFPYAVGTLIANAKKYDRINEFYNFGEIFFLREDTDSVIERMQNPAVVGFSNYLWNYEYNKVLAQKVREKYPDCIIIFGGHHIGENNDVYSDCPNADYFIFGEGEEVFSRILLALTGEGSIKEIPNISYKENGEYFYTFRQCIDSTDYPSPYLTGVFDDILQKHPDLKFYAIIETSRGCPYKCKYCDWGNLDSKRVKFFPKEKIFAEIEWLAAHGVDTFGGADANFGIVKSDEEYIDKMVQVHKLTGHLKNFQTSYAKNSNDIVFNMTKKLNDCGMNKGVTLSFQSLSEEALRNVGRENISIESYKSLLARYAEHSIATYTELILGLPGETYDSFVNGIETLLRAGQHHAIYIHNCEYLPCAGMSDREYAEKFRIGVSKIPLNQPHREASSIDEIAEYSKIVTSTYSMSESDWVKINMFALAVQCLHHGGLLPFFAIYLYKEKGISYTDFYRAFVDYVYENRNGLLYKVFSDAENSFNAVIKDKKSLTFVDDRFGDVVWPAEEYAFLNFVYDIDTFYNETEAFLRMYIDDEIFTQLLEFQKMMLRQPAVKISKATFDYNFFDYISAIYKNDSVSLIREKSVYSVNGRQYDSFADYARFSVWYGRKEFGNLNLNFTEREEN